jgi:hypothetical protein
MNTKKGQFEPARVRKLNEKQFSSRPRLSRSCSHTQVMLQPSDNHTVLHPLWYRWCAFNDDYCVLISTSVPRHLLGNIKWMFSAQWLYNSKPLLNIACGRRKWWRIVKLFIHYTFYTKICHVRSLKNMFLINIKLLSF